jgi:hypothetical protein
VGGMRSVRGSDLRDREGWRWLGGRTVEGKGIDR